MEKKNFRKMFVCVCVREREGEKERERVGELINADAKAFCLC